MCLSLSTSNQKPTKPNPKLILFSFLFTHSPTTQNAECIVVGSTGKNWLERLFLGSVSNYLITTFPHTVVVVPGGPERDGDTDFEAELKTKSEKSGWSDVE